ncbi:unnamed protein product [Caenorhabditis brenneri]
MPGRFSGKVAIITGSSFGIGRETALLFAKEGAEVTVTGRSEERLQGTKKALLGAKVPESNFIIVPADITTSSGQDTLISKTLERFGKIDILVNNAECHRNDPEKAHLAKTKGDIVNVSSIVALKAGWAHAPYYPLAKAALDQYTRSAAIDLIYEGIRVNTVNPGIVETGFHGQATGLSEDASKKFYDDMGSNRNAIPCGFSGRTDHIAKAIAFLADRDTSEYIVGQNIIADGGTSLVLGIHTQFPRQTEKL